jgi:hypothetical protein
LLPVKKESPSGDFFLLRRRRNTVRVDDALPHGLAFSGLFSLPYSSLHFLKKRAARRRQAAA